MTASALESQGMTLKIGDGASPEVFTAIGDISDISGPDGAATEIDVTTLDSTGKEFRMGLKDEGQVTFTCFYQPKDTQHAALRTARSNRTLTNFQLTFTDSPATVWSFSAYVMSIPLSNSVDGATSANITLRISGSIMES